jgi:hypothetical protein
MQRAIPLTEVQETLAANQSALRPLATTTFDLRSQRVVHHVSIGRGWYTRRRTYAFAEIAGLRMNGYDAEPDSYMPVVTSGTAKRGGSAPQTAAI